MKQDRIQIEGKLADQAMVGAVPNTRPPVYRLSMTVVPDRGLPYFVSQNLGSDATAERAARAKQRLLKRGAWVRVFARTLDLVIDKQGKSLVVHGITDVIPMDMPAARSQRMTEESDAG